MKRSHTTFIFITYTFKYLKKERTGVHVMIYIKDLLEIGLPTVILVILGLFFAIEEITRRCSDLLNRFGIQTKSYIKKQKQEEMLSNHNEEIQNIKRELQKNNDAMVSILRADIIRECKKLQSEEVQSLSPLDYENLAGLFNNYKALGGNHLITKLYDWFKNMPVDLEE